MRIYDKSGATRVRDSYSSVENEAEESYFWAIINGLMPNGVGRGIWPILAGYPNVDMELDDNGNGYGNFSKIRIHQSSVYSRIDNQRTEDFKESEIKWSTRSGHTVEIRYFENNDPNTPEWSIIVEIGDEDSSRFYPELIESLGDITKSFTF